MRRLLHHGPAWGWHRRWLAQSVGLVPGQSTAFTLPASAYTTALHFDVPAGTTSIKVELESDTAEC